MLMLFSMATTISHIDNSQEESVENLPDYQIPDSTSARATGDWEWSTSFGSLQSDETWGIVVNQNDESLVTGHFRDTVNFGSCSSCTHTSQGNADIFIAKLDNQGNVLWVNTAGGSDLDAPIGHITQLDNGNYAIAGYVGSGNVQFDSITLNPTGVRGLLIAVFDDSGNWIWANEYSGPHSTSDSRAYGITSDASNIYVTGEFTRSMDVNGVTYNAYVGTTLSSSMKDLVVMKVDYSGNYVWSQFSQGGEKHDGGRGIAVDSNGEVYIVGRHSNNAPFGNTILEDNCTNSYNPSEGLIAKLDYNGNWLWALSNYGCHIDVGIDIGITPGGDIVATTAVTGEIYANDITGTALVHSVNQGGASHQILTAKYKSSGALIWYDIINSQNNHPGALTIAPSGEIFLCGYGTGQGALTSINTFSVWDNQWSNLPWWINDVFVGKYKSTGELDWVVNSGLDPAQSVLRDCALNQNNVAYIAGSYDGDSIFQTSHVDIDGSVDGTRDAIIGKLLENYSSPNPLPCSQFNGMLGPVWDNSTVNNLVAGDIYEHPEGSGLYWQVINTTNSNEDPGTNPDIWSEACTCYEIWSSTSSPVVWNVVDTYDLYDIVEYPAGSYQLWHAVDNVPANEIPDDPNNWRFWQACEGTECAQFNGTLGPVWDSSMLTSTVINPGDIYEFPANSGIFWMVNQLYTSGTTASNPGSNPDVWGIACNCSEIWDFNGQPTWDPTQVYSQFEIVESPTGSGDLWSPNVANVLGGVSPELSADWDGCGDPLTPCEEAASLNNNWPMWTVSGPPYDVGDVVSYGNEFYISIRPQNSIEPGPNGVQALAWIECTCDDLKSGLPAYSNSIVYYANDGVVWNNEVYWSIGATPIGNTPSMPGYWRTCDWCESSNHNIEGEWNSIDALAYDYDIGDIVTVNGQIWVSILENNVIIPTGGFVWPIPPPQGTLFTTPNPIPMWDIGWVQCDCSDVAEEYDSSIIYDLGDVIIGPDGNIWVSQYASNSIWPSLQFQISPLMRPITIPMWRLCEPGSCMNPNPWNSITANSAGYFSGDIVSHASNTWVLMSGFSGNPNPPSLAMIQNPGPWTLCGSISIQNPIMLQLNQGEINLEEKSIQFPNKTSFENGEWDGLSSEGKTMISGFSISLNRENYSEINSAIWSNKSITELDENSLKQIVEGNILIVDVCDQSYGLNGYREERYLCGIWHESETDWNDSGVDSLVLSLIPGRLCTPEMGETCKDIILDLDDYHVVSNPVENISVEPDIDNQTGDDVTDDSTEDTRVPGFSAISLVICMIFSALVISRRP